MKRNNIFGAPIFKKGNFNCPHFVEDNIKKGEVKFTECTVPIRDIYRKENKCGMIIQCPKNHQECPMFMAQSEKDILIIGKYIEKYSDENWINIPPNHWSVLRDEKISINRDEYLMALFNYYGWCGVPDDKVEGILMTSDKVNIYERVVFA